MQYVQGLAQQSRRVISVDALRGFSFIWILGAGGAILALGDMVHGRPVVAAIGEFWTIQFHHLLSTILSFPCSFPHLAIVLSLPRLVERFHYPLCRIAMYLGGGDIGQFFDQLVTKDTGPFVASLLDLAFVVLIARLLYQQQIFLRV